MSNDALKMKYLDMFSTIDKIKILSSFTNKDNIKNFLFQKEFYNYIPVLLKCINDYNYTFDFFMNTKDRVALYGAGGVGKAIKYGMSNSFPIWVDRNYSKYQKDEVLPVESLIQSQKKYDKVFIALSNVDTCRYIKASLIDMGISKPIYYYGCVDNDL